MFFPKINLHTHTTFSDGKNSIKQMVINALKLGLNYLAITDHFSDSWKSEIIPTLDNADKIKDYLLEIEECQNFLKIGNTNLKLYKGIEIDIGSSINSITSLIQPNKFNIILFEYLETQDGITFIKDIIQDWKKRNLVKNKPLIFGLAHFDPSHFIYEGLDKIIHFLDKYNIYVEFNSRYSEYYSRKNLLFFEKLKEQNIPVAIGSDAHNLKGLSDINDQLESIREYGLENNLDRLLENLKQ